MKPLSANKYASEAEIVAEFEAGEAQLAQRLLALRQAPGPALEARLRSLAAMAEPNAPAAGQVGRKSQPQQRWAAGLLAVALILALALAVIGPQRVLAEFQRLLGYLPGYGFVDPDQTRVLTAPVTVERNGVSVTVVQLIAGTDKTQVTFLSQGLDPLAADANAPASNMVLLLPDGQVLTPDRRRLEFGNARLDFPPLPPGITQVTLKIARLPLVAPGAAPEDWAFGLVIRPAVGTFPAGQLAAPYVPEGARTTVNGVTLEAIEVVPGADETAVTLEVSWEGALEQVRLEPYVAQLRDDVGHTYLENPEAGLGGNGTSSVVVQQEVVTDDGAPPPTALPTTWQQTYNFKPLSPSAGQVSLQVDELEVDLAASDALQPDLGANPQVGQHWILNETLPVQAATLHFTGATLLELAQADSEGQTRPYFRLQLDVTVTNPPDLALQRFGLWSPETNTFGDGYRQGDGWDTFIFLDHLPQGALTISLRGASARLHGPWVIEWDLPSDPPDQRPLTLHPPATDTHHGVTLGLSEVVASDRMTYLALTAAGLPAGGRIEEIRPLAGLLGSVGLSLEDQWGQSLPTQWQVRWQPPGTEWVFDPLALLFEPIPPLAQALTLVVPEVVVQVPGSGRLSVEVPPLETLTFTPLTGAEQVIVSSGGQQSPAHDERSQSWTVDLQVELAGYALHYNQAYLERVPYGVNTYRYTLVLTGDLPARASDGWQVAGLRGARTDRPDGSAVVAAEAPGGIYAAGLASGWTTVTAPGAPPVTMLRLDVNDPQAPTGLPRLLPGHYELSFESVSVAVSGPWRLDWSLVDGRPK